MSILQPPATTISPMLSISLAINPGEIEGITGTIGIEIDLEEITTDARGKIILEEMKGESPEKIGKIENQENQGSQGSKDSQESQKNTKRKEENQESQEKIKRKRNTSDVTTKKEESSPEDSAKSTTTTEEIITTRENTTTIEETTETEETTIETSTVPEETTETSTEPTREIETMATIKLKTVQDTKRSEEMTPEKDVLLSPGTKFPASLQEKTASTSTSRYFSHNSGRFCPKSRSQI